MLNKLNSVGLFPFKTENGNVEAISTCKYFIAFGVGTALTIAILVLTIYIMDFKVLLSVINDIFCEVSYTDGLVANLSFMIFYAMFLILSWKIFKIKEQVANQMTFMKPFRNQSLSRMKYASFILIPLAGLLQSFGFLITSLNYQTLARILPATFAFFLQTLWFNCPSFALMWIFQETMDLLENWIQKIQENIQIAEDIQSECSDLLHKGLKKVNNSLSSIMFGFITLVLSMAIIVTYTTISFIVGKNLNIGSSGLCFL